jgi:hypothetical protein
MIGHHQQYLKCQDIARRCSAIHQAGICEEINHTRQLPWVRLGLAQDSKVFTPIGPIWKTAERCVSLGATASTRAVGKATQWVDDAPVGGDQAIGRDGAFTCAASTTRSARNVQLEASRPLTVKWSLVGEDQESRSPVPLRWQDFVD